MNRFLIGFAIGAAIGVAVVVLTAPRSGNDLRSGISGTLKDALDAGKLAATVREEEMWSEFRARLTRPVGPLRNSELPPLTETL